MGKIQINYKMKVKKGIKAKNGNCRTNQQPSVRQENEVAGDFRGRERYSAKRKIKAEEEGVQKDATARYRSGRGTYDSWEQLEKGHSCPLGSQQYRSEIYCQRR